MHLLVIFLIAAVLFADQGLGPVFTVPEGWRWLVPVVAYVPPLVCLLFEFILIRRTLDETTGGITTTLIKASWRLRLIQCVAVGCSVIALVGMGWLEILRESIGDMIVIDEIVAVIPALVLICLTWVVQWPLERVIREAQVMRRFDQGLPVHPVPTRAAYVLLQVRTHLLVILIPAVMVLVGAEIVNSVVYRVAPAETAAWLAPIATGIVAVLLILLAPIGVVLAIGARPLPEGTLRTSMQAIIEARNVRVRNIMLWPTGGTMLNGAVIGFLPRIRYVLLTDGLLETLSLDELRAVMAHEVGHLRFRHLQWTCAVLLGLVWLLALAFEWIVMPVHEFLVAVGMDAEGAASGIQTFGSIAVFVGAFAAYGWVSRRFERQADVAAACDLSGPDERPDHPSSSTVTPRAAALMCGALESVAILNGLDPERNTLRHGSIRWRQKYLLRSIGQPIDKLQIDALVRSIKAVTAITLAFLVLFSIADIALFEPLAITQE